MYALLVLVVHGVFGGAAALAIAPYSLDPAASSKSLWTLSLASALLSTIGFTATSKYLGKRVKPLSGAQVGLLCGALCGAVLALLLGGLRFSLVLYLAILVPTLASVLLATLMEGAKSGWRS